MTKNGESTQIILGRNEAFYQAFESLEIQHMEKIWTRGDSIICVHPGWNMLTGWEKVMNSWRVIFDNATLMQFRITDARVFISEDCAWVVCMENITSVLDASVSETKVLATNIFVNRDDQWLMMHHHGSPVYEF